jgi:hypothetical protein
MKPYCIICNNNTIMATKTKIPIGLALDTALRTALGGGGLAELQFKVEQHVVPLADEEAIATGAAVHDVSQEPVMTTPVLGPYE